MRLMLLVAALASTSIGCHRPWLDEPVAPPPPPPAVAMASGPIAPPPAPPAAGPYQWASYPTPPAASAPPPVASRQMIGFGAARAAQALEGKPYCWGGTGPDCYDCSGLTTAAWATQGIVLPRTSDAQREQLRPVHWSEVQPGDVLWRPGHVGLYVERGWAIHAPGEGKAVQYQAAQSYEVALRPY